MFDASVSIRATSSRFTGSALQNIQPPTMANIELYKCYYKQTVLSDEDKAVIAQLLGRLHSISSVVNVNSVACRYSCLLVAIL